MNGLCKLFGAMISCVCSVAMHALTVDSLSCVFDFTSSTQALISLESGERTGAFSVPMPRDILPLALCLQSACMHKNVTESLTRSLLMRQQADCSHSVPKRQHVHHVFISVINE